MSLIEISRNIPLCSEEFSQENEDSFDILYGCKKLLSQSNMKSIKIIFHEIVDMKAINREIYTTGIVDNSSRTFYSSFFTNFQDYIADLNSLIAIPSMFKNIDKAFKINSNENFFDRVFYNNSFNPQNAYDINGSIFNLDELLESKKIKNTYKFIIFWENLDSINLDFLLELTKISKNKITFFFISSYDNFIEKKFSLSKNKITSNYLINSIDSIKFENNDDESKENSNVLYIFDNRYLQSKYHVLKFPWLVILNKKNIQLNSSLFRKEEIENIVQNFRNIHPTSVINNKNLFWVSLNNQCKKSLIKEINESISENGYKMIFFYVEMNASIAMEGKECLYNIDGYFTGNLCGKNFNTFKAFTQKLCQEKKLQNIYYNLSNN